MEVRKSFLVVAALLAFGVGGPAVAIAADDGNKDDNPPPTATALATDEGQSTADEQQTGEQGDVENTDLATEVEQADGANDQEGVNEENEVGDGENGQVDDDASGDTEGE